MPVSGKLVLMAALLALLPIANAGASKTTVCTITVNSPDERETFRRSLPSDRYEFVELVERGRPDWLASACRKHVRCDVLLISGHFDGGDEFYSDRVDARESLPVDEMERVSCSDSCSGLFSQLKEVYLFGCNTLNGEALTHASGEVVRSLVRAGHSAADAERIAHLLAERHSDSNRERMRQIFKDVPVIYGFSSKAPLGRNAGPLLERYFQSGAATEEIGSGRPSPKLLGLFAPASMTVTSGSTDADPQAAHRRDACHFADDRLSAAQKLAFVHELLGRDMAEVRMYFDQIERYAASLGEAQWLAPDVARSVQAITDDAAARDRFMAFARDADQPSVRARMIALAARFGWLTPAQQQAELAALVRDRFVRSHVGLEDVELVCALNRDHALDPTRAALEVGLREASIGQAAILACLGSRTARAQVVDALTGGRAEEVQIAQVYLRHHPIADVGEVRGIARRIASVRDAQTQIRALDTLARLGVSDRESLEALTGLFPVAKTVDVQRAIAGILIRADYRTLAKPELVRALRQHRLKSPDGQDLIDVLIRRMQASLSGTA
ncbi:MAG: hypothetical protein ACM3JC_07150 [Rudaea sp.]